MMLTEFISFLESHVTEIEGKISPFRAGNATTLPYVTYYTVSGDVPTHKLARSKKHRLQLDCFAERYEDVVQLKQKIIHTIEKESFSSKVFLNSTRDGYGDVIGRYKQTLDITIYTKE